jgi:hypothetical protein
VPVLGEAMSDQTRPSQRKEDNITEGLALKLIGGEKIEAAENLRLLLITLKGWDKQAAKEDDNGD